MDHSLNPRGKCLYCGADVHFKDDCCSNCGEPNVNWIVPGKNQCGNCHAYIQEGDKYCRICGTKVGDGRYEPYQDLMECIYGPMPITRKHFCKKCGYSWTTCLMIDNEEYCPQCGSFAPYEGSELSILI